MLASTDNWSTPIREWLFGILWLHIFHFLLTCIVEIICYFEDKENVNLMRGYKMLHLPLFMFLFAWFILGNIWWFGDSSCDDFPHGYYLTLALLILYYMVFTSIFAFLSAIVILYCTKRQTMLTQLKSKLLGGSYDVIE